jgi:hypothetical protein
MIVPWSLKGLIDVHQTYRISTFNSEYGGWMDGGESPGRDLVSLATPLEQRGFYILRFEQCS